MPFPPLAAPSSPSDQSSAQETLSLQIQWPSGHTHDGLLSVKSKVEFQDEDSGMKYELIVSCSKKKQLAFSFACSLPSKSLPGESSPMTSGSKFSTSAKCCTPITTAETLSVFAVKSC
ncbi:hypothetical protein A4A49_23756 [Nicotiana attenuata]|uniref:Uncharacterized protein n=1 Tax=Nicotiana attenuata TaxID=49451 RepID=A0A314KJ50_NICAT|nr:hypothetical protein A4A49_23756 [Nicotiana attenuata]